MRAGDLILIRGSGWLSRGILKATGCELDGPSHVAVAVSETHCVEALGRGVVRNPLAVTLKGCQRAWILSFENLSDAERQYLAYAALGMEGLSYGYAEIGLQLLDSVFRTTWWTDSLSRNIKRHPICSYVGARVYSLVRGETFGKEDESITPGDAWRYGTAAVMQRTATMVRVI